VEDAGLIGGWNEGRGAFPTTKKCLSTADDH